MTRNETNKSTGECEVVIEHEAGTEEFRFNVDGRVASEETSGTKLLFLLSCRQCAMLNNVRSFVKLGLNPPSLRFYRKHGPFKRFQAKAELVADIQLTIQDKQAVASFPVGA